MLHCVIRGDPVKVSCQSLAPYSRWWYAPYTISTRYRKSLSQNTKHTAQATIHRLRRSWPVY